MLALALLAPLCLPAAGCAIRDIRAEARAHRMLAALKGSVRSEVPGGHPLVVVLVKLDDAEEPLIAGSYTVPGEQAAQAADTGGSWFFRVLPGRYQLAAFQDVSGDLVYRPGEPVLPARGSPVYELAPGEAVEGLELVIRSGDRLEEAVDVMAELEALRARAPEEQLRVSVDLLAAVGEVVGLDDPRFERRLASLGARRPNEFLNHARPGIYFLGDYDPGAIPVLFVHGMAGTPRDFEALIAGLDRGRYQAWIFYYPSGARLPAVSRWLTAKMIELRLRLRFESLVVVAHSMGGLVAREFIAGYYERTRREDVRLFVSISTPWGGDRMAAFAASAPERRTGWASWRDLAPESPFLRGLFRREEDGHEAPRPLPPGLTYHLIFGHPDSVVPLESALALAEYEEATVRRFPLGHVEILTSPDVVDYLNRLLERVRD
jgi:pimeloyl-ACP methyl ester carboxylesterase